MESKYNAVVSSIVEVSPTMRIFRISPLGWELPDFVSGQFASLALTPQSPKAEPSEPDHESVKQDKLIKRVYSIASSSKAKDFIEFYISLVTSGALTPRLFALKIGDKLELGKRMVGMFTLEQVPKDNNVVLIATGTGVAPYISMLRSNILGKEGGNIVVIHGAAHSWDLGYRSELMLLDNISPRFSYFPTILEPEKEPVPWGGDTRFVQDMWIDDQIITKALGEKSTPENTHIFLCGNPRMVEAMFENLEKDGFVIHKKKAPGQIHVESWG